MGDKAAAKKMMAEANTEYKAGKLESALEKYSKAIELDPKEVMYPANRANIYLKMKKWKEAEKDCTDALKINNNYAKALDRRGQARLGLKNFKEALEDFEAAKKADPKTANVDKNIETAEKKMSSEAKTEDKKDKVTKEEKKEETEGSIEGKKVEEKVESEHNKEDLVEKSEVSDRSEGFTKTDEDLLKDIENIQAELARRMEMKEKQFANKELEVEKEQLEHERQLLLEERWKFEEILRELFEEEQRREDEESDEDDDQDENENLNIKNVDLKPRSPKPKSATPEITHSNYESSDDDNEEEIVPVRSTRWHPTVGKAPAPNLKNIRSNIDNKNNKYHPPSARRVEIFHDSEYLRNVKEAKLLSANPRRRHSSRSRNSGNKHQQNQEQERPRSLVLQKVEQDNSRHHRRKSNSQDVKRYPKQDLEDDRMMVEDARKALVKERLELELLRRQMERKKREAEEAEESIPVSIDPFRDEDMYKPKHQNYKTQFEIDFENKWKEKFGESYHGGL